MNCHPAVLGDDLNSDQWAEMGRLEMVHNFAPFLIVFEKYVWNKEITDIPFKTSQFSYKLVSKLFLWNLEIRPKAW